MELSRSTWLITSLSPGGGEKMPKHSVSAGNIAALLSRFSELKQKAFARMGQSFPIIGLDRQHLADGAAHSGRGHASVLCDRRYGEA
jgi:transposase